ncbi:uncharacterized protein LOC107271795 [Cephus cinctus]|uniref:Uncharacterized protein LOC107271795 n=1 Tax=Cephus cinctus TaxID=211228 RepID=A0AAJ7C798_CEPCN|nr:uncharacterized protein LOC107271795 [Cephus cinctus]
MNLGYRIIRCIQKIRPVLQKNSFATTGTVSDTKTLHYYFLDLFKRNDFIPMYLKKQKLNVDMKNSMQFAQRILATNDISSLLRAIESAKDEKQIILHRIDIECCDIIQKLSYTEILQLLNALARKFPHRVTLTQFYKKSIEILMSAAMKQTLSHLQTIELLFYLSMNKKNSSSEVQYITSGLPNMINMSLIDKSIIAYAAFKTYVKLNATQIRVLEKTLEENASFFVNDPALLVTLCKAIRHAGVTKELSLNNLSGTILQHQEKFRMKCAAHVLALYAEAYTSFQPVLQRMFKDSMEELSENIMHRSKDSIRIKDLDRLLWAGSRLNYQLEKKEFSQIQIFIQNNFSKYLKNVNLLVNTLLCLKIMEHDCKKIIEKCLEQNIFPSIYKGLLWKPMARLQLLITSIQIENPEIDIPIELTKEFKVGFKVGENIKMIFKVIRTLKELTCLDQIRIECPVLGLYIPGISVEHQHLGKIHIDILDEITCLRNTRIPHGLMHFKLRLLKKLGYYSILIDNDRLNNNESIYEIIEQYLTDSLGRYDND